MSTTSALSFTAAAYFIVAVIDGIRRWRSPSHPSAIALVVHSWYVWAGLLTLTLIPVATKGQLEYYQVYVVFLWPVIAFVLGYLLVAAILYVPKNSRGKVSSLAEKGLFPAVCAVLLVYLAWFLWDVSAFATHPNIRRAEDCAQSLEGARIGMEHAVNRMNIHLGEFRGPILQDHQPNFEQLRASAVEMITLADALTEQHRELVHYHEQFLADLQDAPGLFQAAAEVWRGYAAVERSVAMNEIAAAYDESARMWDAYAQHIVDADDDPFSIEELDAAMFFVGRARLMLHRLVISTPVDTAAEFLGRKTQFEAHLRLFVQRFDELRGAIRGLTERVRNYRHPDEPETSQAEPQDAHFDTTGPQGDTGAAARPFETDEPAGTSEENRSLDPAMCPTESDDPFSATPE